MITVHNRKQYKGDKGIYVGRPTPLGNPFSITPQESREVVIERYRSWLEEQLQDTTSLTFAMFLDLLEINESEGGLDLLCHCKPKPCHADIIKEMLEEYYQQKEK